jgi:hypothetical protein
MKTRICEKCGAIMEEIKVDSPHDVEASRCPNWKNHPSTSLE